MSWESWPVIKDLKPPVSALKAEHLSSVTVTHIITYYFYLFTYNGSDFHVWLIPGIRVTCRPHGAFGVLYLCVAPAVVGVIHVS